MSLIRHFRPRVPLWLDRLREWESLRLPQDKTHWRVLALWLDVLAINALYYLFLKALIFYPLDLSGLWQIFLWGALFTFGLHFFNNLHRWRERLRLQSVTLQWTLFMAAAAVATFLSNLEPTHKGFDFSWLRPEMIKIVWWLRMFIPLTPVFTLLFAAAVTGLMVLAIAAPRSRILWLAPLGYALVMIWLYLRTMAPIDGIAPRPDLLVPERLGSYYLFAVLFGGPPLLFFVLLATRIYSMAFRMAPIVFFFSQILFNYIGLLPMQSIHDLIPLMATPGYATRSVKGVSMFYPPPGTTVDTTFTFLRKMVGTPDRLYVNYGPTCGIYAFDRASGRVKRQLIPGLMRDLQLSPDGRHLWATNWYSGDFLSLGVDDLKRECQCDIFPFELMTPIQFLPDGQQGLYVSNVTPPIVAHMIFEDPTQPCRITPRKTIDFQNVGYTAFSDGVYGIHLDVPNQRLYALVGMLGDRFLMGLVELDAWSLRILREVRLRGGMVIAPVKGRRNVLIPSYYSHELHEVSLDTMKIVRTMKTDPNILGIEHDSRRGLFYAVSRATGMLSVINDATGRVVRQAPVGNKAEPMWFDEQGDRLFVGSSLGIVQFDLARFLEGLPLAIQLKTDSAIMPASGVSPIPGK